ncbi:MAG TPA: DUF58 domain-containing protein [Solirubrobacteraceae bacterium]|jgi:uncharacterized protein (DUF58 family)|nr:DUF58 domain-containing protein [Solirubrobacteraceae bacterium]
MRVLAGSFRAVGVLLAGLVLMLIALAFDASQLMVPAIAFVLLGAVSVASVAAVARGVSVSRRLDAERVIEDEPLEATVEVRGGTLGVRGTELHDPIAGEPLRLRAKGRSATIRLVARFERRGLCTVAAPELDVSDPLGLCRLTVPGTTPAQQVLVLPRTERVRWRGAGGGHQLEGAARAQALIAVEVDGLRPYQPGTPASRIHWPALARGAGLLERRMRADEDQRPLVVLDVRGDVPDDQLDAAVRAAASLTLELARAGGCLLLLPRERRPVAIEPDLIAWPGAHVRLALVDGGPRTPPPMLAAARQRPGPVIYVSAAARERLPAAFGAALAMLVVPAEVAPASVRPSLYVSGCIGGFVGRRAHPRKAAA